MLKADSLPEETGQSPLPSAVSLLIVGGGIMGLWAAVKAERLGIDTLLFDAGRLGEGASGGLLGALMPHMPDRWSEKKQFQFDALVSLEADIATVEAETGLSAGYRRSGRIIPLPKPHLLPIAERQSQDALSNWNQAGGRFFWHVLDAPPVSGWVSDDAVAFVHDTLAARVSPRCLTSMLKAFLKSAKHVQTAEHCGVTALDALSGKAVLSSGQSLGFGHVIVAAGHHAFPMIGNGLKLDNPESLGKPVKGQAALLKMEVDPAMPVVFLNGLYVVPHENGTVAIGSTSEDRFEDPLSTDDKLDALIEQARQVVPSLRDALVAERWAGLRPKAIGRDPMVGAHPDHPRLVALTGGFKVSFGLAHRLADAALRTVLSQDTALPSGFTLEDHIRVSRGNI